MAQDLVKSAARALDILEVFAARQAPLTATELGAALGYPKSSMSVLLKSLVTQGYLSLNGSDQGYFPTFKVARLGDWIAGALLGSEALLPLLERLRDATGETVTLTTASDLQMRCLHALIGTHPIALQVEEGVTFPMIGTAIGTAWLSAQEDGTVRERLKRWQKLGGARKAPLDETGAAIAEVRARGYATAYDAVLPDTGAIAMPLRTAGVGETLVIAVAGLNDRIHRAEAKIVRDMKKLIQDSAGLG